jgi:hypothetical protein
MDAREQPGQAQVSPGLVELIGRAMTDERFREALYTNREHAVRGYRLTDFDREALANLPREKLEEQVNRFGAGTATGIEVGVVIKGSF